jgi:hypothetical protein
MRILVAARAVNVNTTAQGISTSKFLAVLRRAGHEITCLTSESLPAGLKPDEAWPWLKGIRIELVDDAGQRSRWGWLASSTDWLAARGGMGAWAAGKPNALIAYATGFQPAFWRAVRAWRTAIQRACAAGKCDLLFVRGAGLAFDTHVAMLGWKHPIPWIANYHDPFAPCVYPEPARRGALLLSRRQKALHHAVFKSASALTFTNRRLLEWLLRDGLAVYRRKAFVVPQIAMDLPHMADATDDSQIPDLEPRHFNVIHPGTFLDRFGPPYALVEGFSRFVDQDDEKAAAARLWWIGKVGKKTCANELWPRVISHPNMRVIDQRVRYQDALGLTEASVAGVIIEGDLVENIFFAAKMADYLWLNKPVLAITNRASVTADLLGPSYPLLVAQNDIPGVLRALNLLWRAWKGGRLNDLTPPAASRAAITEESVRCQVEAVIRFVCG